jgi:hypothetical protein
MASLNCADNARPRYQLVTIPLPPIVAMQVARTDIHQAGTDVRPSNFAEQFVTGLRSLTAEVPDASRHEMALALAIHRASEEGRLEVTLSALAAETGIRVIEAIATVGHLAKKRMVRLHPRDQAERMLAPVDWLKATPDEQLQLIGTATVEMTPLLPPLLEGRLDYSPAADDAIVAATVDALDAKTFPHPDVLAESVDLPRHRAHNAVARYLRGALDRGMRLRITVEVTFPELTPDDATDYAERLTAIIAQNDSVRCVDVKLRSVEGIPLTE